MAGPAASGYKQLPRRAFPSTGKEQAVRLKIQYLLVAALGAGTSHAAPAQSQRGSVEQIGSSQPVGMQQVATRSASNSSNAVANGAPPAQLSTDADSAAPAIQLTRERGSGPVAQQLTRDAPTAQPSEALSKPQDGRTGSVERVAGSDRCDPRADRSPAATCARVIETRAAEFTRRDPTPLSPEQRILVEQQAREHGGGFGEAARRLAANGEDSNSLEAQGVASVVLRAPPPEPRPVRPEADPATNEAMTALVNAIVNAAPAP
jgi:hypothetical protein